MQSIQLCTVENSKYFHILMSCFLFPAEESTVGISFDATNYAFDELVVPGPCVVTGTLTGLMGDIQQNFSVPFDVDDTVDPLTSNKLIILRFCCLSILISSQLLVTSKEL